MQLIYAAFFAVACQAAVVAPKKVATWKCALKNCALKSPLASAGPGFADGVNFFAAGQKETCPFGGGDDEKEPSKKEYLKYMKGLGKVADMPIAERRAWAQKHQEEWLNKADDIPELKEPSVDVTKSGVEPVSRKQWGELRNANKFDFLITFYAPWCPHCKKFVNGLNAPLNALSESLEKVNGPKVVSFDIEASSPPGALNVNSVPTIYLFKKTGEAIEFTGNPHELTTLMEFALDRPKAALVAKTVEPHMQAPAVAAWKCPLKNCLLTSPLAAAGPAFQDGVNFFATKEACPFGGGDDEKEPSKKEYLKYMKALDKVGEMTSAERRAYAIANKDKFLNAKEPEPSNKPPSVDVSKPGVHDVNSKEWSELRNANKFDMLITFYAPWCPYCKKFIKGNNAPIKALSETMEKVDGPKVITFDMKASTPPLSLDGVPTIYLFLRNGQAIEFEGNHLDLEALGTFALRKE